MAKRIELVRGTVNVSRDFQRPNVDLEHLRSILAARIICVLDRRGLSVRKAARITGIAADDFSRIRRANFGRLTVERLMTILARLDQQVHVRVTVRRGRRQGAHAGVGHARRRQRGRGNGLK